ncbi:MAG: radical SAM protein, partial [Deltaproteobacteria bacterium]|nr:radical SAM protein [Deltaproteobacteria bacterium]
MSSRDRPGRQAGAGPLLKSHQRSKPPLGYPRETDSLCPRCVIETRQQILDGRRDVTELVNGHVGEIKALFYEEDNCIKVRKTCPTHGTFEDLLSIDAEFSRRIEARFPGRDYRTLGDELIHRHGTSSVRYGRGAVLTIDLTNRCNMMCNPCFMDANQVGYVHELTMDEVKRILDDSISFKPRRQMSVQFSGGEPTLSPHFFEACSYAKAIGYCMVQAATNGLRFALEPDFAERAKEAGFDMAYLQFDGVTNEANAHRHITNLWDVRQLAIENMVKAGIKVTPVVTVVNGLNNHRVGELLDYCMEHHEEVGGPAFQPVSFTGRDEG